MYDELIKRLRRCASYDPRFVIQDCKDAADAIEELVKDRDMYAKAMTDEHNRAARLEWDHRWIPVMERLPDEYVNVLCHLRSLDRKSEYYSIDHLMNDGQWWKAANSWKYEVTHWMPLPKPPEKEE